MKKDHTRDYVTEMFRVWALNAKRVNETSNAALAADICAVENTFSQLEACGHEYIVSAVKAVYCATPDCKMARNTISYRVRYYALSVPCSEKQVYDWLKKARTVCAINRGLRL